MTAELFPNSVRRAKALGMAPEEYVRRRLRGEKFCGHKDHMRWLSVDDFYTDNKAPDGLRWCCKRCHMGKLAAAKGDKRQRHDRFMANAAGLKARLQA